MNLESQVVPLKTESSSNLGEGQLGLGPRLKTGRYLLWSLVFLDWRGGAEKAGDPIMTISHGNSLGCNSWTVNCPVSCASLVKSASRLMGAIRGVPQRLLVITLTLWPLTSSDQRWFILSCELLVKHMADPNSALGLPRCRTVVTT